MSTSSPSGSFSKPTTSRWARMGGVVRRASSVLVPASASSPSVGGTGTTRPSTPSIASSERDTDATSMKGSTKGSTKDTNTNATTITSSSISKELSQLSPPIAATAHFPQPSPIAESPARELEASREDEDGHGDRNKNDSSSPPLVSHSHQYEPSPLSQQQPHQAPGVITASPVQEEYTPPPLIDSTAVGPGGFSDDLEDEEGDKDKDKDKDGDRDGDEGEDGILQPWPRPRRVDPIVDGNDGVGDNAGDAAAIAEEIPTEPVTPVSHHAQPQPQAQTEALPETSSFPVPEPEPEPSSYFEIPVRVEIAEPEIPVPVPMGFDDEDALGTTSTASTVVPVPVHVPTETRGVEEDVSGGATSETQTQTQISQMPNPHPPTPPPEEPQFQAQPQPQHETDTPTIPTYALPPTFDYYTPAGQSGEDVWGGGGAGAGVRMPAENPFLDPAPPTTSGGGDSAPTITVSQPTPTPEPAPFAAPFVPSDMKKPSEEQQERGTEGSGVISAPVHETSMKSGTGDEFSLSRSYGAYGYGYVNERLDRDENLPLLYKSRSNRPDSLVPQPSAVSREFLNVSAQSSYGTGYTPHQQPHISQHQHQDYHNHHQHSQHQYQNQHQHQHTANNSAAHPRLHDLGWIEYQLPDGTVYYVHPTKRVTADVDLRDEGRLVGVGEFLGWGVGGGEDRVGNGNGNDDENGGVGVGVGVSVGSAPAGMELWLCNSEESERGGGQKKKKKKNGKRGDSEVGALKVFWVDHRLRMVSREGGGANKNKSKSKGKGKKAVVEEDDRLDMEYRYWSFIESHPAHTTLPPNAKVEAMEVLTWAWTDRLLPSNRSAPALFSQEECQELMSLLRSFEQEESGIKPVVQTRIVARILIRVAQWRQHHFRPNKPLPTDVVGPRDTNTTTAKKRRPLRRVIFDFVVLCVCLGIPFIFFERRRRMGYAGIDEERSGSASADGHDYASGSRRPGPMFVVGACSCLVAAVILSASVTFLSLPGLDNFARVAGFVAILFATFSMASTLVALFRYKADLEDVVSHIAGEGLMMLSKRSVVFSLPLVFLVYSIVAFATGIVLYSFRGSVVDDPLEPQRHFFEDYTKWTVVGVLGGLAGVLFASVFLRR